MNPAALRSRLLPALFGLACAALGACGDDLGPLPGDDQDDGDDAPLYLAASWVADDSGANTYVTLVDDLDSDLDFTDAIEIPGYGDAWVFDEWIFVSDGESPTVRRYRIGEDDELELDAEVSFLNTGVTSAAFYDNQIVSRTKAYLANPGGREYVVWNPETMAITGTMAWPEIDLEDDLDLFHSYMDRGGEVIDGYFFHGIYQHNENWDFFGSSSVIAVYDVATDQLVDTIEVPCPMMDVASTGEDGSLYVSGWSYIPLSVEFGLSTTNCAARIDTASRALDSSWTFEFGERTGGHQGMAVRVREGSAGTIAVFLGSDVDIEEATSIWDLDIAEDDWEIYSIDLATREVAPTGTLMGSGSFYDTHIDDRYYVYLPGDTETRVYEEVGGAYEPRFSAQGWMSRLFRVR